MTPAAGPYPARVIVSCFRRPDRLRILLVEDDQNVRTAAAHALRTAGHTVLGVEDGATAIERLAVTAFDVVVSDLRLPRADGLEVLRRARETSRRSDVILMTSFANVPEAVEALKTGAHNYLVKPDDGELRAAIAAALRSDGHEVIDEVDGGRLLVRIGAAYASHRPCFAYDLILSDVRMPVCGGLELLKGPRRPHWTIPVVLMSAFVDASMRERAQSFGALMLVKPLDLAALQGVVGSLLADARYRPVMP